MKKIERNEKCPCGSGKKYKKCCISNKIINQAKTIQVKNYDYQIFIDKYFQEKHFDLNEELNKYESQLFDLISDTTKSSSSLLKDYINHAEVLIQSVVSNFTTYELLFWSRRLKPENIFDVSDMTVRLYREVQSLSFYKYGLNDETMLLNGTNSVVPDSIEKLSNLSSIEFRNKIENEKLPLNISNVISAVIRVEILSFIFIKATQIYRIVNKGGEIIFDKKNKKISLNTTQELDFLINLYDKRAKLVNLFSNTGAWALVDDSINREEPYFWPWFQLNVGHKAKVEFYSLSNKVYSVSNKNTNYKLGAVPIASIYNFLNLFETEFQNYYSITVRDFVSFLAYLGYKIFGQITLNFEAEYNVYNRAYIISSPDIEKINTEFNLIYSKIYSTIFGENTTNKPNLIPFLNRFLLKNTNKMNIDLWTRGPKRFFYELSNKFMVTDYTCLTDIVSYIVKEITSVDGEIGNKRAIFFENLLKSEIKSTYGADNMWVCMEEIKYENLKKEIDASFFIDDMLFLLEAKAVNVSFGFDKGDKQAIDFRTKKMKDALKEVNAKAEFIKKYRLCITPKIPKNIKYICPIIVSTFPEYIWSESEELFISKELSIPRIIVISDIIKIKKINISELKTKNWVIEI